MTILQNIIPFVHSLLSVTIDYGDKVIDATAGNGGDTIFLVKKVGTKGKVYAFDIQEQAIKITHEKLISLKLIDNVVLINNNHKFISKYVKESISGAIFNLGYLPNGDKNIFTNAKDVLIALRYILDLLLINKIVVLVLYPGFHNGYLESKLILEYTLKLPQQKYQVLRYDFINRINNPPYTIVIEKISY